MWVSMTSLIEYHGFPVKPSCSHHDKYNWTCQLSLTKWLYNFFLDCKEKLFPYSSHFVTFFVLYPQIICLILKIHMKNMILATYLRTRIHFILATYLHMRTHAYIRVHTHTHAYIRVHTHTYAYTRIHTHTYAYTRIHMRNTRIHFPSVTYLHTCTHAYISLRWHIYIRVHMHTFPFGDIFTYVYTCIHFPSVTYLHTCTHAYISLRWHIYIRVHMHTFPFGDITNRNRNFQTRENVELVLS